MQAIINSAGKVVAIDILDPGEGFSTDCLITFVGGNGTGAKATAIMGNNLVRSLNTTIKYDRYQYTTTIFEWQPNVSYDNGTQVRYSNRVWSANSGDSSPVNSAQFDITQWTLVDASTLSGVDRTMGYYTPTPDQPGLSLPLLIDGIDYPGVQVTGVGFNQDTGFDVGNYDINPFDNISFGPEGRPTYDPALLDAIYESSYLDPYLGTRPTDVNVDGGGYVDVYSSHAPEELIPGAEFDTLDLRVYTTPGSDWLGNGHGFPIGAIRYIYDPANPVLSFDNLLEVPMVVLLFNVTSGLAIEPLSYDWANYQLTVDPAYAAPGDILAITVFATGGGNQIYNNTYIGSTIGNTIVIPFPITSIYQFVIYNGEQQLYLGTDYTYETKDAYSTRITFANTYSATDRINLTTLGYGVDGNNLSWSLPVFETIISDGSPVVELTNSLQGTNPVNLMLIVNGNRARPPEGVIYIGDGATTVYNLPNNGGFSQSLIANNDVAVYVNSTALVQGVDFFVNAYVPSVIRTITLVNAPALGTDVLVSVRTMAQYWVVDTQLEFRADQGLSPTVGDIIEIITWNDTTEQEIVTQVFSGTATDTFDTGRIILNPERVLVTVDGDWLFSGDAFNLDNDFNIVNDTQIVLQSPVSPSSVVAITNFTSSVVPGAMAFRIFQDMRGVQATYRITPSTTTELAQPLGQYDNTIYVKDASKLSIPALESNIWGILTINGERIMYRERNTVTNTISSLLRGTAGTGAASHNDGSPVYDIGRGNLLPAEFQNYIVSDTFIGDDSTVSFTSPNIVITAGEEDAVEVYVGGIRVTEGYAVTRIDPVSVDFDSPPLTGLEVTILVRRGVTWYAPGIDTASDGVPLQDTNTKAARFLRGL
jgi:hypothetical protein